MGRSLPIWSGGSGPRVVIENHDPDAGEAVAELLRADGFDVAVCTGPERAGEPGCPLVEGEACDVVDVADVILYDLDLARDRDREVLAAAKLQHPDTPIIAEVSTDQARQYAPLLEDVIVVTPYDPAHLRDAVVAATSEPVG